jgi:ABC-type nitrate/sulfonate/bicarbonate transport system substrate-binding protein
MQTLKFAAVSRNYFNMPVWIAHHAGLFAAEGLAVAIELHESVDEVTERLRDGRVQLAYGITEHVVLDREAGGRLAIIGGNVNKLPFSLIAGKGIRDVADLRGKVVGVSSLEAGSSSLVMKLLEARGLTYPGDYEIRAVGPILARWRLLQSGEIDAGLQGAPLDYIAQDAGYPAICNPRAEVPDFQFTSLNVDAAWAAQNEALVRRFMRAFVRAHAWFYENPDEAGRIALAETEVEPRYLARAWEEYTREGIFPRDGDASTAAVQALIEISALIRAVPNRSQTTADGYIDRRYLHAAQADLAAGEGHAGKGAAA